MVRYAITDRRMFAGDEAAKQAALLGWAAGLARAGTTVVQVCERDLPERQQARLAAEIVRALRASRRAHEAPIRVLLNGPAHVAIAAGADGLHLRSGAGEGEIERVREVFEAAGLGASLLSLSCQTVAEVEAARGVDYILFGPVFDEQLNGERVRAGVGLDQLREACAASSGPRLLALGGITEATAAACLEAGADGVAGTRLFLPTRHPPPRPEGSAAP